MCERICTLSGLATRRERIASKWLTASNGRPVRTLSASGAQVTVRERPRCTIELPVSSIFEILRGPSRRSQRPAKFGERFSMKARTPSLKSSLRMHASASSSPLVTSLNVGSAAQAFTVRFAF